MGEPQQQQRTTKTTTTNNRRQETTTITDQQYRRQLTTTYSNKQQHKHNNNNSETPTNSEMWHWHDTASTYLVSFSSACLLEKHIRCRGHIYTCNINSSRMWFPEHSWSLLVLFSWETSPSPNPSRALFLQSTLLISYYDRMTPGRVWADSEPSKRALETSGFCLWTSPGYYL